MTAATRARNGALAFGLLLGLAAAILGLVGILLPRPVTPAAAVVPTPTPTLSPSPTPVPSPLPPGPPAMLRPTTGILCSQMANSFNTVNDACNFTYDLDVCMNYRNTQNGTCIREQCTNGAGFWGYFGADDTTLKFVYNVFNVTFIGPETGDGNHYQLVSQFVNNNTGGAPQQLDSNPTFTSADYLMESFAVSSGEYGRQLIVAMWNYAFSTNLWPTFADQEAAFKYMGGFYLLQFGIEQNLLVFNPCDECLLTHPELSPIAYIQNNTVRVEDMFWSCLAFYGMNTSDPDVYNDWENQCLDNIAYNQFCSLFPSYYTIDSLHNTSVTPSPFADCTSLLSVINDMAPSCGPSSACVGVVVPPAVEDHVICSTPADSYTFVDTGCTTSNASVCIDRRNITDQACVWETCSRLGAIGSGLYVFAQVKQNAVTGFNGQLWGSNNKTMDLMVQKFMNENSDAATAQWLTQSYNFTYLTYAALNSFATAQKDFLRQILAAELALTIALDNDGDNALAYNTMRSGLVFAPDTCSDTDLAAIPWLQDGYVLVSSLINFTRCVLGYDVTGFSGDFNTYCSNTPPLGCFGVVAPNPAFLCSVPLVYYDNDPTDPAFLLSLYTSLSNYNGAFSNCTNQITSDCYATLYPSPFIVPF